MTNPALAAAVTAARDFADALESAQAALAAPGTPEVKVGDVAATEADALALLGRLPEGAQVTDRDGDSWTTTGGGQVSFEDEDYPQATANAARYAPLTVAYLPEPTATPEPEPIPTKISITTTDDPSRTLKVEPGYEGEGSVYITVKNTGGPGGYASAWLSRDEARQLAATLTAIADTDEAAW